ncbi:hypothetical protein F5884DRAFT_790344 [Xylogone sp. PMI_703]|nr:hypothetical protein F5884DRAFT_790344 [Xylogone sp. PMI_703]
MAGRHVPKQVSSCDSCKSLRIGCDLRAKGSSGDPCSNCKRRGRPCIPQNQRGNAIDKPRSDETSATPPNRYNGLSNSIESESSATHLESPTPSAGDKTTQPAYEAPPPLPDAAVVSTREDHFARAQLALTLHHMLWDIFTDLFETQAGIWIGNECCPIKQTLTVPTTLISRLMITLDSNSCTEVNPLSIAALGLKSIQLDGNNKLINQALLGAVHAYSARWLSDDKVEPHCTHPHNTHNTRKVKEDLLRDLWAQAYQRIQPAMVRPSYTSILALHLFGNVPTPSQSEERSVAELCLGISLQHFTTMSVRSGVLSRLSKSSLVAEGSPQTNDAAALEYAQMEDTAHWFGIICDASRSLTVCQPSILLPNASAESKIWTSIRQEMFAFQQRAYSQHWIGSRLPSIERLYSTVGNGWAGKAMVWNAISKVQEALFHNLTGISLEEAISKALQEMDRFEQTFGALLGMCRRDFVLLNEKIRICCFLLDLEFALGVLTLVDTLSATSNIHFLPSEYELRLTSARSIVNAVNLMLHTDHYGSGSHTDNSNLLKVPYPENIADGLLRAGKSLTYLYNTKSVSTSMVEVMFCVIFTGLESLQTISYSAQEALESLASLCNDSGIRPTNYQEPSVSTTPSNEASAAIKLALHDRNFVKWSDEHVNIEPNLVNSTIERHEVALGLR